jgi:hypothetical protein
LASQESVLRLFAQTGVGAQQRQLDQMSSPERTMAEAIMNQQADAFANDPYAAGTALYQDVGPALPEEDAAGRLRQERMIETRRGTAPAIQDRREADPSQRDTALMPVDFSPEPQTTAAAPPEPNADAGSHEVQVAQTAPDATPIDTSGRGVAPPTEPPFHDPDLEKAFQQFPGTELILSNGKWVADPNSPTGYVMTPSNDLKTVAAAARRAKEEHPDWDFSTIFSNISALANDKTRAELEAVLRANLGHGGTFDYQRRAYAPGKDGFTQLRQFRSISNISVGLFGQQLGLPLQEILALAGYFAVKNSSNRNFTRPPYLLDADTEKYIKIGYDIGARRLFE